NCPSSATEEIVETVERMSLFPGKGRIGLDGLEHSELGSLAQAHHPTDQHLDVCPERWFGECGQQALQNGVERGYARKHGRGPPCPLRASCDAGKSRKVYKEPRPLSSSNSSRKSAKVQVVVTDDIAAIDASGVGLICCCERIDQGLEGRAIVQETPIILLAVSPFPNDLVP